MSASKYRLDVEKSSGGASSTIHLGGESGNTSGGGEDPDRGLGLGAVNEVSSGGIAARRGSGALKRKEDPKASPNPSLRKDQSDVVNALWANVLPKMTVLVVSSDLVFSTLVSQMIVGLGATPVVVSKPSQTRQILRHRLKYATDVAIIVHQSECYSTILSLDELTNGDGSMDGQETANEEVKEDGLDALSPFAASLDYQPWYDIASRVRHREDPSDTGLGDWIAPIPSQNEVMAVTVIAVITGNPDGSNLSTSPSSLFSPSNPTGVDRATIADQAKAWDPRLADCLQSEAVIPLLAPFSRTSLVLALGHMKQRLKAGKASGEMPDHVVLTVCEGRKERSGIASTLRQAGVDSVSVDESELDAALMLQSYDCILLYMDSKSTGGSFWGGGEDGRAKLKRWMAQIKAMGLQTQCVVLTSEEEAVRDGLAAFGVASVLESPCSEMALFTAVTGLSEIAQGGEVKKGKNRNKVEASKSGQGIKSTDGNLKSFSKPKRRNSITLENNGKKIQVGVGFDGDRKRLEVKRRGSWSGGWMTQVSSDALACAATRGATHHVPQDRVCILENFVCKGHTFFGTFDGHGPLGHHIATFIMERISDRLLNDQEVQSDEDWPAGIQRACAGAFDDMVQMHGEAAKESGCTASFGVVTKEFVYVGNVGDSRTCYVREFAPGCCSFGSTIESGAISVDHTPELESEAERIRAAGGLVLQMGPVLRVVHPASATEGLRGLAMSRSFGDMWASTCGVTAEPQVFVHKITPEDRYIMCGSDGIWDMISIQEAGELLPRDGDDSKISLAVKNMVDLACSRWKAQGMEADDISFVVIAV